MGEKNNKKKYQGAVKSKSSGKNKMATKLLGITLTKHLKTYLKIKHKLEINNLFFVSEEFISKKQLFQIIDMGHGVRSFIMDIFNLMDRFETQKE